jgi:hypothetical protein
MPLTLETTLHKPLRSNVTLCLPTNTSIPSIAPDNLEDNDILTCYTEQRIATTLAIKHAITIHYNEYESALLQMFVRKPRDALKHNFKIASSAKKYRQHTAPINLSIIRDPITRRITSATPNKSKKRNKYK